MTDFEYSADAFFDYLPSVWGKFYKDQDQLATVYEGWMRSLDSDYASIAQTDAAKDLSTLPSFTRYPAIQQTFGDWTSLEAHHAHRALQFDWPAAVNGVVTVRLQDQVVSTDSVIYIDGYQLPSFLYRIDHNSWYDGAVVSGTSLTFDMALLDAYAAGDPLGAAYDPTGTLGAQNLPDPTTWVRGTVLVMRELQGFTAASDGSATTYDLAPTVSGDLDLYEATITLQSIEADRLADIAVITDGFSVTSKSLYGFGEGTVLEVYLNDGTVQFHTQSGTEPIIVTSNASTIEKLRLRIDFQVDNQNSKASDRLITVTEQDLTLHGQQFYSGARIRVTDPGGTQSFVTDRPTAFLRLNRAVDPSQVSVRFLGVDLMDTTAVDDQLQLASAASSGVSIQVVAPIERTHGHAYETTTLAIAASAYTLETPVSTDVDFPLQVFADGLLMTPVVDYSFTSTVVTFVQEQDADTVLDFFSTTVAGTQHRHVFGNGSIAPAADALFTYEMPEAINASEFALQLYRNGVLYTDYTVINDQFLRFSDPLATTEGFTILVNSAIESKAYEHDVSLRTDGIYGYVGQLHSFTELRDSLKNPTATYTDVPVAFDSQVATTIQLDDPITDGWFVDVLVDEQVAQKNWGRDINYIRETSDRYSATVAALYTARYEPSTIYSIENYGSIILGSPFTTTEATSLGRTGTSIRIRPTDTTKAESSLDLLSGLPVSVKDAPETMPRFWALNHLVTVHDRDNLANVPWLVHFAEEVGLDYQFAKRHDASQASEVTGVATTFDHESGVLTDAAAHFTRDEVRPGDLIQYNTLSAVQSEALIATAYLYDNEGYIPVTSATYAVPDGTYTNGSVAVEMPIQSSDLATALAAGTDASEWSVTTDNLGNFVLAQVDPGPTTEELFVIGSNGGQWRLEVDTVSVTLQATFVTATPTTAIGPVVLHGVGATYWEVHVSELPSTLGTITTTASTLLDGLSLSRIEVGTFVDILGLSSPWPTTDIEEAYEVAAIASTSTTFTVTAHWLHTTVPSPVQETNGITLSVLDETTYLALPPVVSSPSYAVITAVLDDHTLQFPFESQTELLGFGEGPFGAGPFGGAILSSTVSSYTVYARRTRRLDTGLFYDQALPTEASLSTGEDIVTMNAQLATLLAPHNIAVEYEWASPRTAEDLEDLLSFIETTQPAETNAFVYTEAFKGTSALQDSLALSIDPNDTVDVSLATGSAVGAAYFVGAPIASATLPAGVTAFTVNPGLFTPGTTVESQIMFDTLLPTTTPVVGGYYVVVGEGMLQPTSVFARLYTEHLGLGDAVLQVIDNGDTTYNWETSTGMAARASWAVSLENRALRVPYTGVTNKQNVTPQTLSYTAEDSLTFECTVIPRGTGPGLLAPIFEWGGFQLLIETDTPADPDDDPVMTLTFQATSDAAGKTGGFVVELDISLHIVITYSHDGTYGHTKLYVDGALVAENTPGATPSESTTIAITATDVFIGSDSAELNRANIEITQPILYASTLLDATTIATRAAALLTETAGVSSDGEVLAPTGATFWLNTGAHGTALPDFTGNGFSAQKIIGNAQSDWRVASELLDSIFRTGDVRAVRDTGLVYHQGVLLSQAQLASTAVSDPALAATLSSSNTINSGDISLTLPNTWISYGPNGWETLLSSLPLSGASVSVDTTLIS